MSHLQCCSGNCRQGCACPAASEKDIYGTSTRHVWAVICAAILAALLLVATPKRAYAATLGLHLATAHFGGEGLHSSTPGVYLTTNSGLTLGAYSNSYGATSTYAAWTWQTADKRFALTAGGVTGYPAARVMPLLVPSVRIPIVGGASARLSFLAKPPKKGSAGGLHLSVERSF